MQFLVPLPWLLMTSCIHDKQQHVNDTCTVCQFVVFFFVTIEISFATIVLFFMALTEAITHIQNDFTVIRECISALSCLKQQYSSGALSVFLTSVQGTRPCFYLYYFFCVVLYRKKSMLIYLNARLFNHGDVHMNELSTAQDL